MVEAMAGSPPAGNKRPSSNTRDISPPAPKRRQQSTISSTAVAKFFTPASQKEPDQMSWRIVRETLLVGKSGAKPALQPLQKDLKRKVAIFDFDSTLIRPRSMKKFSSKADDWKWWDSRVPQQLRKLHEEGYLVAVLSNQGGIRLVPRPDSKSQKADLHRLADFKTKVGAVMSQLEIPLSIYAATENDHYRKPRIGMWKELLEDHDLELSGAVDLEKSFFVGDAGGRAKEGKVPADFSCSDRDLATNVGITFHTPEEYFLRESPRKFAREFDPSSFFVSKNVMASKDPIPSLKTSALDIILFCGSPGAGKSTFYWRQLQPLGYGRVNQDILKSRENCLAKAEAMIKEGTSVAVDNTNADVPVRADWIALATKLKVPIRCALFTTPTKVCEHNNAVRGLNPTEETNPEQRALVPKIAILSFAKRYKEPSVSEGFQDIIKVDFEFNGSDEHKSIWSRYWL